MPKTTFPDTEFAIFNAALSLLKHLDSKDAKHASAYKKLVQSCYDGIDGERTKAAEDRVNQFVEKFMRSSSKSYGEEGFDLRVIKESLDGRSEQKQYLRHSHHFHYKNQRQLINIVTKVINHFHLIELAQLVQKKYFSEVDGIAVEQYLDPEYKKDGLHTPETRYPSLLKVMHPKKSKHDGPKPGEALFQTKKGMHLVPKNKMNPRLPLDLSELNEDTPEELKYHIGEFERLKTGGEIIITEEVLKKNKNKHASPTPGPFYLSSFPVVSSINNEAQKTETVDDLIAKNVCSVLTIEAKNVPQRIYNNETKALPSDWIQRGVRYALIQCPDLHAMRIFHTLLAAQYLFSEALHYLPEINSVKYSDLINQLMAKRFEDADRDPTINKESELRVIYDKVTTIFSHKTVDAEVKYYRSFMSQHQLVQQQEQDMGESKEVGCKNPGRVLVHCKAGMSRSFTALLSMYIFFIDAILLWHHKDFVQNEQDEEFFGAIIKAIYHPSKDPLKDVDTIVHIFSKNYRLVTPLDEQKEVLAQIIQYKRNMLMKSELQYDGIKLEKENIETSQMSCVV